MKGFDLFSYCLALADRPRQKHAIGIDLEILDDNRFSKLIAATPVDNCRIPSVV